MRKKINGFYKITAALTAAVMLLSFSACSGGEPAVTEGTTADAAVSAAADTTADTAIAETSAQTPEEIVVEMAENQVYDGSLDLIAMPDNPGCEYPANEGEVGTAGAGRLSLAGEPYIFLGEDGRSLGISNRVNRWDSVDFTLGDLEIGNYTLEVKFRSNQPMTFYIEYADTPWEALATSEEGVEATLTFDFALDEKGVWNAPAGVQNRFRLNASSTDTFYIESIKLFLNDGEVAPAEKLVAAADLSLPSLAETYKDHFLIGSVFSQRELDTEERFDLIKHHFNALTAENAMKPDSMRSSDGFNFEGVDGMISMIQAENISVIGHTLAWHNQSPAYLNKDSDGNPLSREEAEKSLKDHIQGVAGHYAGKILSWDVLNEAISDGSSADWKNALRRNDWFNAFNNGGDGTEYVEFAFRAAREADPNAILYYNDYNLDGQAKAQAVANMVREINEKYAAEGNDRLLIEGIGMQGHYSTQTSIENVENSLKLFISLGVEVSVTELDVTVPSGSQELSEDYEKGQAIKYAELMSLYKKYSDSISRVTFWGLDDATSWRAAQFPLLFNRDLSAKSAYYAVSEPEKYLEENAQTTVNIERSGKAVYGSPSIDAENPDALWDSAEALPIDKPLQAWDTAAGTAKVMWDEENLYVLFEINDPELDASSDTVHMVDSAEAFVDWKNCKAGAYAECDGQYRVTFENVQSFGSSTNTQGFESAAYVDGARYRVVMKIPAQTVEPEAGMTIGFDAQINDAKDGSRSGITKWNDATDNSWQDTSNWGELELY